jgi:CubicO group peptidase (beta-lactamase class C family)
MAALMAGCLAALVAESLGAQGAPTSTSSRKPDFSEVREFIRTKMGVGTNTPSLAVAVARGNEFLWEEGFGSIDGPGGTAATPETLYYSASVTKAITATALMILHERRQLDLDRPANLYLKTAKLRSPHWNPDEATVRHVGTHTAGLTSFDGGEGLSAADIIRRHGILFWRPGDHFDYSNLGFGILGQIIGDVSGRSFQTFVHDEVLRPLAMEHSWAGAMPTSRRLVAPRYSSLLRAFSPPLSEPALPGASVLYSSAHELALFGMFHLKAQHPAQKNVLSHAGIDGLQEPAVAAGSVRQSLAWSINDNQHGYRTLLAQGGTYDSQAWLLLVPSERIVIVALANAGNAPANGLIDQILSLLLPTYRDNLAKAAPPVSTAAPSAATTVRPAPPELAGTWSGEIQTHDGNRPLVFTISSEEEVEARLGSQAAVKLTNTRARDNRVTGRMPGDLAVDDTGGAPYELRFNLYRHENALIGSAVTYAVPGRDGPRLPFWVELKRLDR